MLYLLEAGDIHLAQRRAVHVDDSTGDNEEDETRPEERSDTTLCKDMS